jgi:WhiB family redox-sensing transcriptional regulator
MEGLNIGIYDTDHQIPVGLRGFFVPTVGPDRIVDLDYTVSGWQALGECRKTDTETFYPEKGRSTREAKAVCVNCQVRAECLKYALDNDERFGVWGGLSERERRKLKKSLN